MNFVLDTVTLDSFFHNLLLGIPKLLLTQKYRRRIKRKYLARFPAASAEQISAWEAKNDLRLPDDLKNFYSSTNGFHYKWICSYGVHKLSVQGRIEINNLENLVHLQGFRTRVTAGMYAQNNRFKLRLGKQSKVFELCSLDDNGRKITLVFLDGKFEPTIWLCSPDLEFYYLAENFTTYFRMAVAHVGFPNWQMLYAPEGVPEWTRILMRLISPKLLVRSWGVEQMQKKRANIKRKKYESSPANILDPSVFDRTNPAKAMKRDRSHSCSLSQTKKRYHWVKSRYLKKACSLRAKSVKQLLKL